MVLTEHKRATYSKEISADQKHC